MYFRTTTRRKGAKVYQSLHLVESYRTRGGKVRQRILINFGSAHRYTKEEVQEIIGALRKFFGLEGPEPTSLSPDSSLNFGGTYVIFRIWEELGWSEIVSRALRGHRHDFDVIANLKVLVANRLLDPKAKLHLLDWMEGVYLPGIDRSEIDYNHLLRAMDFLIEHKGELEPRLASPLVSLFDTSLDLVFYDLTSCYFEIDGEDRSRQGSSGSGISTLRNYGHNRDRSGCPQVVLGLVMTRDGLPLTHYVFPGETPDKVTLKEVITDLKARFPIRRSVVVADRGLLTEENLEVLSEVELDYIVARPLRRNKVTRQVIEAKRPKVRENRRAWAQDRRPIAKRECFGDIVLGGRRFVLAHSEEIARQTRKTRTVSLSRATSYITWRVARTVGQQNGTIPVTGKALSHQETLIHLHDYLRDLDLSRYYRLWLDERGTICWEPDKKTRSWENEIDGKLVLETTNRTMTPEEVVHQYKELQDIERCFRTLKSSLDIRPMYHWVDRRIEAHIFICVMALQIQRLMRQRLRGASVNRSPERALEKLSFQRTVEATANSKKIRGLVRPTAEQLTLFKALSVPPPQPKHLANPAL
jgi:transposase